MLWQLKNVNTSTGKEAGWIVYFNKKNVIENNFLLKIIFSFFLTLFLGLPEFKNHIVALGADGATVNSVKKRGALAIMKEEMP